MYRVYACRSVFEAIVPPDDSCHEKIIGRYKCLAKKFRSCMYTGDVPSIDDINHLIELCSYWNTKGGWGQDLYYTLNNFARHYDEY